MTRYLADGMTATWRLAERLFAWMCEPWVADDPYDDAIARLERAHALVARRRAIAEAERIEGFYNRPRPPADNVFIDGGNPFPPRPRDYDDKRAKAWVGSIVELPADGGKLVSSAVFADRLYVAMERGLYVLHDGRFERVELIGGDDGHA